MTPEKDDDALSWAGDDDPTLTPQAPTAPGRPKRDSAGVQAENSDSEAPAEPSALDLAEDAEDAAAEAYLAAAEKDTAQLSSAMLISYGILGGVYFLETMGWLIHVLRNQIAGASVFQITDQIVQFLAIASAPLWFTAALLLTRNRTARSRIGWLLLGAFVLVPWPFVLGK
jgi:hypothetical protein